MDKRLTPPVFWVVRGKMGLTLHHLESYQVGRRCWGVERPWQAGGHGGGGGLGRLEKSTLLPVFIRFQKLVHPDIP